jgi:AraC family transcriptional regulator, transcriptional activator of pobA
MDNLRDRPDKTRIRRATPNFGLYGRPADSASIDFVQCERIPVRSSLYNWNIEPHFHAALLQTLLLTAGGGELFVDGRTWSLSAPCLIVVPARAVHGFRFTPDTDGTVVTAAQSPLESVALAMQPDLLTHLREPAALPIDLESREGARIRDLLQAIENETAQPALWQTVSGVALMLALFVSIARLSQNAKMFAAPARSRLVAQAERLRALIDRHCRDRRPVKSYAKELGLSPGQLTRIAHAALGMSALQAIDARALHEAKRLLVYSTLSIKQIAGELGFRDEAYFGRFFRKQTGRTPTEFRATALTPPVQEGR